MSGSSPFDKHHHVRSDATGKTSEPDAVSQYNFEQSLLPRLQKKPRNAEELIDRMAELVALNLPLFALKLQTLNKELLPQSSFPSLLINAAAHMQNGNYVRAKQVFMQAHELAPNESAVHANMAMILYHEQALSAARAWVEQGLQSTLSTPSYGRLRQNFTLPHSFGNCSHHAKLGWEQASINNCTANMSGFLQSIVMLMRGERSDLFMVAYTGTLGGIHDYAEICKIAWQMTGEANLSSQLCTHFAQAFSPKTINSRQSAGRRWPRCGRKRDRKERKS